MVWVTQTKVDATTSVKMEDFVGFKYMTYKFESCPDYYNTQSVYVLVDLIVLKRYRNSLSPSTGWSF